MNRVLMVLAVIIWGWLAVIWMRRRKQRQEYERLSITPEALRDLLATDHNVMIIDARQPLDLLADSEIIEGSQRISPQDATDHPELIPADKDLVVYCTCPSDKTSRAIALRAQSVAPHIGLSRVKFLKGGLIAWESERLPRSALR